MAALTVPTVAGAATSPAVSDCTSHGRLTRQYSITQLHAALAQLPTDIQEYTNCYAIIQRALLAQVSGSRPAGGQASQSSGSSFLPLPIVIVLIALGVGAVGFGALTLRRR
jgi:hypothetical protein